MKNIPVPEGLGGVDGPVPQYVPQPAPINFNNIDQPPAGGMGGGPPGGNVYQPNAMVPPPAANNFGGDKMDVPPLINAPSMQQPPQMQPPPYNPAAAAQPPAYQPPPAYNAGVGLDDGSKSGNPMEGVQHGMPVMQDP